MVAGTLARGGAEKQFVYMVRALKADGADVQVFSLTRGEYYESALAEIGVQPNWVGRHANPVLRAAALAARFRSWRPDVVQAGHFYANLHAVMAAAAAGALSLGSVRSDAIRDVHRTGTFGRASLRAPRGLVVNSHAARANAVRLGRRPERVLVVPNVIDLAAFDAARPDSAAVAGAGDGFSATVVARLIEPKRLERFLHALAMARREVPEVRGRIAGEGPERGRLERLAADLGLLPQGLQFLGEQADVPAVLAAADVLMLTSDQEGFPNVLLEAMAARLPVICTPAGDAARIVLDGDTGFVVDREAPALAARLVALARDRHLARRMGAAGRARVEREFSDAGLGTSLRAAYAAARPWAPRRVRAVLA
jgi:glycosyltransferase involved in cell wall biosynthesis